MSELQYVEIWDPALEIPISTVSAEVLAATLVRATAEFNELQEHEGEHMELYDRLNDEPGGIDPETARDLDREHSALCDAMDRAKSWANEVRAELARRPELT